TWVTGLARALTADQGAQNVDRRPLEPGVDVTLDSTVRATSPGGVVWVEIESGGVLFNDMATPVFTHRSVPFPLTRQLDSAGLRRVRSAGRAAEADDGAGRQSGALARSRRVPRGALRVRVHCEEAVDRRRVPAPAGQGTPRRRGARGGVRRDRLGAEQRRQHPARVPGPGRP